MSKIKESFIEAITFSGSIALAIFLGYGLFSWNWILSLKLSGSIWLVFFMVMFCGNILTMDYKKSSEGGS